MHQSTKSQRGFTIIEVMIVLVIVAVILLIVFLAIPAAQRMNRNNARRNAVNTVAAEIGAYAASNGNRLPGETSGTEDQEQCDFLAEHGTGPLGSLPGTVNCSAPGTVFNGTKECIFIEFSVYSGCFHSQQTSPHTYIGPLDEISLQLGHWCGLASSATDFPITSGQSGHAHDPKVFAVWTAIEQGTPYCTDNKDGDE